MKILKLLNNFSLTFLLIFFLIGNAIPEEPVDIWNLEKQDTTISVDNKNTIIKNEDQILNQAVEVEVKTNNSALITQENNMESESIKIFGLYDPSDHDLTIDMWSVSNGKNIIDLTQKLKKINLSEDAKKILNVTLLTNSYSPTKNITPEEFLEIKSNWLIQQKNLELIEEYLIKNPQLKNRSSLIEFYLDHHLSASKLSAACDIFDKISGPIKNEYILKFRIYCFIVNNKLEEAQLQLDLIKEDGFKDKFFEEKFYSLMGFNEKTNTKISEKTLLDFHLSHRTNSDFKFEPSDKTSKKIWSYLSSSNLLESIDEIDLENEEKILTIEKATHEKNYQEDDLFDLYKRFLFNINQLLNVEDAYKSLKSVESRALLYQGILISKNSEDKLKLMKILKDNYIENGISNAFNVELMRFLEEIDEEEVPSNYTSFYIYYLKSPNLEKSRIKFNNKIIHQSKILNYFIDNIDKKIIEKDLENLLKKVKRDKKYNISVKDIMLIESLLSDGIKVSKKFDKLYNLNQSNIPLDLQILINNNEIGLSLLRLAEIIGEDEITNMDLDTIHFIISALNQLDIDFLRNEFLLKVLPLKV